MITSFPSDDLATAIGEEFMLEPSGPHYQVARSLCKVLQLQWERCCLKMRSSLMKP